jgi:hypothetical protein
MLFLLADSANTGKHEMFSFHSPEFTQKMQGASA